MRIFIGTLVAVLVGAAVLGRSKGVSPRQEPTPDDDPALWV